MAWSRKQICDNLKQIFNGRVIDVIDNDTTFPLSVDNKYPNFDTYDLKSDWSKEGKDYKLWFGGFVNNSYEIACMVLTKKLARELSGYDAGDFIATVIKRDASRHLFIRIELLSTGKRTLQEI